MASSRYLITSTTLGSSAASVTFSSIPSTYTDLVLKMSLQTDKTPAVYAYMWFVLNGDTTNAWYSDTYLYGDGASVVSLRDSNATATNTRETVVNSLGGTTNTFSNLELYLPNYNSTTSKPYSISAAQEANSSTGFVQSGAYLYRNTTGITSISLYPYLSNWNTGSSFYLYGIKNS